MNIFLTVNVLGFLITIQILQYVIIIYVKQMLSKIYWFISVIYTFGTQSNWNQMCELCHSGKLGSLQGLEWKLLRSYLPPLHIHENLASLTFRRLFFTAEPLHSISLTVYCTNCGRHSNILSYNVMVASFPTYLFW